MKIEELNTNGYNLGDVTHYDFKLNGAIDRDYGYRVLVTVNEDCFFVVKYGKSKKDYKVIPKSVKYFVNMPFPVWENHNTHIMKYDPRPDKPTKLPEFLLNHEDIDKNKTNKTKQSLAGIAESTKKFFQDFEDTREKGGFVYHSYYTQENQTDPDVYVSRIACTTSGEYNVVLKTWNQEGKDTIYGVKFDKTPIEEMSKEWNMIEARLSKSGADFLDQLKIKGRPTNEVEPQAREDEDEDENSDTGESNTEHDSNANFTDKVFSKNDKLFSFRDTDLRFYIINERAVIIMMFRDTETYLLWDLIGGEDHRIITSAKGPFDESLSVNGEDSWATFRYDQDSFLLKVKMTRDNVRSQFAEYSNKWVNNLRRVEMFLRYKKE